MNTGMYFMSIGNETVSSSLKVLYNKGVHNTSIRDQLSIIILERSIFVLLAYLAFET